MLENYIGITVKYTLLSDKGADKIGNGVPPAIFASGRYYDNQYNKQESWIVNLIDKKGEKVLLISTDKQNALDIITVILTVEKNLKPFLSNYRKEFELSKDAIMKGKVVLLSR